MPLGREVGLSPSDIVLDGDPAPFPPKGGGAPNFRSITVVAKWLDGSRYHLTRSDGDRSRLRPHCVLDGDPAPPAEKVHGPQFSANVNCGQTAGWTKMPLGREVGLGPGDFVLDGDPAHRRKMSTARHPIFGPCLLWPSGWMDQDAT